MLVSVALTAGNKVSNKAQTLAAKRVIDRFLSGQTDNAADIPYHVALDMQKVDGCDQYCVEVNRQGVLMINASSPVAAWYSMGVAPFGAAWLWALPKTAS